jgi:phospholipase/carboxylesterase
MIENHPQHKSFSISRYKRKYAVDRMALWVPVSCLLLTTLVSPGCGTRVSAPDINACPKPQPCPEPQALPWTTVARKGEAAGVPYMEVLFGETDPNAKLPLIVAIHGLGDRARVPVGAIEMLKTPVRVILPNGPTPHHTGFAWTLVRVRENRPEALARDLRVQANRLAEMIKELLQARPTLGDPIVLGGSQGGMLTFALALHHPDVVGHAMPLMGWLPPPLVPDKLAEGVAYPAIRSIHGAADEVIPLAPTQQMVKKLRALGLKVELVGFDGVGHYMTMPMEEMLHQWLVEALATLTKD